MAEVPSSEIRNFKELTAWQLAMDLAVSVFKMADAMPPKQQFGLANELRRTAVSPPSNIAEGFARHSRAVYRSHVAIALGSLAELETQTILAERLVYISDAQSASIIEGCQHAGRVAQGLWRSLS